MSEHEAQVTKHSVKPATRQFAGAPLAFSTVSGITAFHRLQVSGFGLSTDTPQGVFVQVRVPQGTAGFSDSFAIRVEVVNRNQIDLVIRRVDAPNQNVNPSAQFRFDILVSE